MVQLLKQGWCSSCLGEQLLLQLVAMHRAVAYILTLLNNSCCSCLAQAQLAAAMRCHPHVLRATRLCLLLLLLLQMVWLLCSNLLQQLCHLLLLLVQQLALHAAAGWEWLLRRVLALNAQAEQPATWQPESMAR